MILCRKRFRSNPMNMMGIRPQKIFTKKRLICFRRFFCFMLIFFSAGFLRAQGVDDFTSSLKAKRSFYFTWDSKATFISNEYAQVKSVKLGFDFGGKTKFGIGYNWYKGNISRTFYDNEKAIQGMLKFRYGSIFTEYVYFLSDKWEATIPAQLGMGITQYNHEITKEKLDGAGGVFFLYEASSTLVYRFLRYFGAGLGIGFRLVVLTGDDPYKENFQSPVLTLRTKVYFDQAMADIKKKFF
jgi:hypothetical protein